ncbi:hypothetical protein [Legionella nagasakiensis]|uniref:hypothetical protein n=1 Tax=Legionella nagasakiensis TaxID=535290 RepID=UPI001054A485|nr:hypothetical protein [Legionella nagasakiensis]
MPGFFSSETANALTARFHHLVDWSRVGELLASGRHRYTTRQLIERGVIIAAMGAGVCAGYNMADSGFGLGSTLYSMAGCFIGFVASHAVVILPLIHKRYQMSQACSAAQKRILSLLQEINHLDGDREKVSELVRTISRVVAETMTLNLSDEQHARASQTWGARRALMEKISDKLSVDFNLLRSTTDQDALLDELNGFWSQEQSTLHVTLRAFKRPETSAEHQEALPASMHLKTA